MVMQAGYPGFSPEFEELRAELQSARERYAVLVEEYTHLTGVAAKNLESEYMLKLGKKEHELYSCQVEILQLKREISLYQAARNRRESISHEAVKKIIEKEFAEYQKQIEEHKAKQEFAKAYLEGRTLSEEEMKALKKCYHGLVRKLHPDLNPCLPEEAASLWNLVQIAYQMNDWKELFLLAEMADEVLAGKKDFMDSINSLVRLQEELEETNQKTAELREQITETRKRIPFVYEKILNNPGTVSIKRHELDLQINLCKERIKELTELRNGFGV